MEKEPFYEDYTRSSFEAFHRAFPGTGKKKARPYHPAMYDIVLINDDFTSADYVLCVLEDVFHINHDDAAHMMLLMQQHGEVVCGTYTKEVAETKMIQVDNLSRENMQPLRCTIRKEVL